LPNFNLKELDIVYAEDQERLNRINWSLTGSASSPAAKHYAKILFAANILGRCARLSVEDH
jgi:hypothetical protein